MDFESYLINNLSSDKYKFEIATEQTFVKENKYSTDTIYVLIKYLSSDIEFGAKRQPIQILFLTDENEVNGAREVIDNFVNTHNWVQVIEGDTYFKQQYSNAVVLSNFQEVKYGMRSLLYVTGTLYIMDGVIDVKGLQINNQNISPVAFNLTYSMTGNTQPLGAEEIAQTVKNLSTVQITMTLPFLINNATNKVIGIISGGTSGNANFNVKFALNNVIIEYNMKCINAIISTAQNQIPSLQLGLMR